MARLAAVCRRSWGVIVGNVSSTFWHFSTAWSKNRGRKFEPRNTPPRRLMNTRSSRPLPIISADSSSANDAGNGTERRSPVLGVLHTSFPASVTDRDTLTRRRSMSKSHTRSAAISPHRSPV